MDKDLFSSIMRKNGDTQADLAKALGISLSRLNAKINERDGAQFDQVEMGIIIDRYKMSFDEAGLCFFTRILSQ